MSDLPEGAALPAFAPVSLRRKEDLRLITGQGRYVGNLPMEGGLHAAFVRSDTAHGVIESIDLDDVRTASGVGAVYTAGDLAAPDIPSAAGLLPVEGMDRPVLAGERVRFVGEAVAMVLAESEVAAVDAAGLAWVDIDPLDPVIGPHAALAAGALHPAAGSNVAECFTLGDADAGWGHEVETEIAVVNQRLAPLSIEPLAVLAEPIDGGVRVTVGHQRPHMLKGQLERLLGCRVQVVVPDVGGGFGKKGRLFPEYVAVALAARRLGRPVRWLQTRREALMTGTHGRDIHTTVRLGGDRDGRLRRVHVEMLSSVGAYPQTGAQVTTFARLTSQGLYDVEQFTLGSTTVVTTQAPIAPYRGAGRPEAAYAIERGIDAFAVAAGLDPIEVRHRNFIPSAAMPFTTATGAIYDSGDYAAALDLAMQMIDLEAVRAEQERRRQSGEHPLGIGVGAFVERAGGPVNADEYGRVELLEDGFARVLTGSTSNGQGHETVWAQLAAQVLTIDPERVSVVAGDTEQISYGSGSTASRSAQLGGSAVWIASTELRNRAARVAAQLLEASPDDLVLADGRFGVAGVPDAGVDLAEVAAAAPGLGIELSVEETFAPGAQTFPYGVHVAVVEVDVETGDVRLLRFVAVDDTGNVLSPMIVEGQTHGSVASGIGQALYEQVVYGDEGQLLTSTLMDYIAPRAADIPDIETSRVISPAPSNPLGVKGAGEGGNIGAPPALVTAVLDALRPLGVTHIDMPLRPEQVWNAIQAARG